MKRDSLSFRGLEALAAIGPAKPQDFAMRAYGHCSRGASTLLSHLRARGLVECQVSGGRVPGLWRVTPLGLRALAEPYPDVLVRSKAVTAPELLAGIRKRYKISHDEHVTRQELMGIPKALITEGLSQRTAIARGEEAA